MQAGFGGNPDGYRPLARLGLKGRIILKLIVNK